MDIEKQKEYFKNHIATFSDYGNIKIIDFANPESCHYRIRFIFEEDFYRLHISGDLGELIASNYNNMCYRSFSEDFVHNTEYFMAKVNCHNRPFYEYDYEKAKEDLNKRFNHENGYGIPYFENEPEPYKKEEKGEWWIITFGDGQEHEGKCVKIKGSYGEARAKMVDKYGIRFAFQYSEAEWEKKWNDPDRLFQMEDIIDIID